MKACARCQLSLAEALGVTTVDHVDRQSEPQGLAHGSVHCVDSRYRRSRSAIASMISAISTFTRDINDAASFCVGVLQ